MLYQISKKCAAGASSGTMKGSPAAGAKVNASINNGLKNIDFIGFRYACGRNYGSFPTGAGVNRHRGESGAALRCH